MHLDERDAGMSKNKDKEYVDAAQKNSNNTEIRNELDELPAAQSLGLIAIERRGGLDMAFIWEYLLGQEVGLIYDRRTCVIKSILSAIRA